MKKSILIFSSIILFLSCDGTLGGFNTIRFPVSKKKLEMAFDTLYIKYPDFKIPKELRQYDKWSKRGYDFLESRIFYLSKSPKVLYYVSFVGDEETFKDTTHVDIAIRSVFIVSKKRWLNQEDFDQHESDRIQARFKTEIISKLEHISKSTSTDLGY